MILLLLRSTKISLSVDTAKAGIFGSDNLNSNYLDPIQSEHEIDYSLVYAIWSFFLANIDGQISVKKGESLELLDDSNSYWWAVKCLKIQDIGYIPAENIEVKNSF